MKQQINIDDICMAQLEVWEDFLIKALHAQSDSLRTMLKSMHPEYSDDGIASQWVEFGHKQLENWTEIEQEFVNAIFHSIKEIDLVEGFLSEAGTESAHRFLDHWGNRAGKAFETHTEFYSLIFPWEDGETEPKAISAVTDKDADEEPKHHDVPAAA